MKNSLLILVLALAFSFCAYPTLPFAQTRIQNLVETAPKDTHLLQVRYSKCSTQLQKKQWKLREEYLKCVSPSQRDSIEKVASSLLMEYLCDSLANYWLGTPWDFNGYTASPNQGQVACGYLVSTLLKQGGFNLNRFKLAQQYSHSIANTLCDTVKTYTTLESLIKAIRTKADNIWIVGLDNHVGMIVKRNGALYFLHASYYPPKCAVKEPVYTSPALAYSTVYVSGPMLGNSSATKAWLKGSYISIKP